MPDFGFGFYQKNLMGIANPHIGLYFGSFNPIHIGHIKVAKYLKKYGKFDSIWFVPSPLNPQKSEEMLLPANLRLNWVKKAIAEDPDFKICDVEFGLGMPSYTYRTVKHLYSMYSGHIFSLLMGADNLIDFHSWNDAQKLAQICPLHVYARPGFLKPSGEIPFNAKWYDSPLLDISATQIRNLLFEKKDIGGLIPASILLDVETFFQNFIAESDQ